ncbi:MAG: hypothetical protein J3K34DRAFT_413307 [Monoraphidium minutum]|nr:MAG: hypothetical protein J3K34DRAFT_413307 [Monoraphidium minutum]
MDDHLMMGQKQPRSALAEMWQAPTTWDSLSYDSESRRSRITKKVCLALFLFLAGFGMLAGGIYLWYTDPGEGSATALLILGSICFLPGSYFTRIAYLAWRGVDGYSLNSIPDM